jgi:hypothetical protein
LRRFSVSKDGTLGLDLAALWDRVQEVALEAPFLLLGVPSPDPAMVAAFRRPYAEGDYVPPHILGDWDAVEQSNWAADRTANFLLEGLAGSEATRTLCVRGGSANSVKLIPGGNEGFISWVHSVAQQSVQYLYGMSGAELAERLKDLMAAGAMEGLAGAVEVSVVEGVARGFDISVRRTEDCDS